MSRRSTPQKTLDERAFPVRIRLVIPSDGLKSRLDDVYSWLARVVGAGNYAVHSSHGLARGGIAIYLRSTDCAAAFVSAFPDVPLADGIDTPGYTSPIQTVSWSGEDLFGVCNLYSMTKGQDAIRELAKVWDDRAGNMPSLPGIFPDYQAPVVSNSEGGRILSMMRWGMPSPAFALKNRKTDTGVTNVRNTTSSHWRRWLGVKNRCVVPFTSFCEYDTRPGRNKEPVWFAIDDTRPLAFFAGIWTEWTSVRKLKEGETTNNLFAFLTTEANATVSPIHPKAMPVILTTPDEIDAWLSEPTDEALQMQRPLPDDCLQIVARGSRSDSG